MTRLPSSLLIALVISVGPSAACDPEEMIKELREHCRDAIEATSTLLSPLRSELTPAERSAVDARLAEAGTLCDRDKYADGFLASAKLARFVGHVEARRGVSSTF
jgi:hypothetical protein